MSENSAFFGQLKSQLPRISDVIRGKNLAKPKATNASAYFDEGNPANGQPSEVGIYVLAKKGALLPTSSK